MSRRPAFLFCVIALCMGIGVSAQAKALSCAKAGAPVVASWAHATAMDVETTEEFNASGSCSYPQVNTSVAPGAFTGSADIDAPGYVKKNSSLIEGFLSYAPPSADEEESGPVAGFSPLSANQKFSVFLQSQRTPFVLVDAALSVGVDHATHSSRPESFSHDYTIALADNASDAFFAKFVFPAIYRHDPRYFRMKEGTVFQRGAYAVSRVFLTRRDDGLEVINTSHILARFISKALANMYYRPQDRSVSSTLRRTGSGLMSDAGSYLMKEFWPDLRKKILPARFRRNR